MVDVQKREMEKHVVIEHMEKLTTKDTVNTIIMRLLGTRKDTSS